MGTEKRKGLRNEELVMKIRDIFGGIGNVGDIIQYEKKTHITFMVEKATFGILSLVLDLAYKFKEGGVDWTQVVSEIYIENIADVSDGNRLWVLAVSLWI